MKKLDTLALALVVVGALNWGLVALAEFDLVATIFGMEFGETSAITREKRKSGAAVAARARPRAPVAAVASVVWPPTTPSPSMKYASRACRGCGPSDGFSGIGELPRGSALPARVGRVGR